MIGIVPARSGSQRLKNKNVRSLNGKPLVFYTLEAFLGSNDVEKVIFTTDSQQYIDLVSENFGDNLIYELRPKEFAANRTKVVEEIARLLKLYNLTTKTDTFIMGLPTAPLRSSKHIQEAIAYQRKIEAPVFSACKFRFPVQFAFSIDNQMEWHPLMELSPMLTGETRSQEIESYFRPNGAIYINNAENFFRYMNFYGGAKPFLMDEDLSLDIDTLVDFKFAELMLETN